MLGASVLLRQLARRSPLFAVTQLVGVIAGVIFVFGTMITVPDGLSIASAQTGQAACRLGLPAPAVAA